MSVPVLFRPLLAVLLVAAMASAALLPAAAGTALAASSLQLSRSIAGSGDTVAVTGNGFHAGDAVVVQLDLTVQGSARRLQTVTTVGANGGFRATLTIPAYTLPRGYTVKAQDLHGNEAISFLHVLRTVRIKAGGPVSTFTVRPGHRFYVRGSGFPAGDPILLAATYPLYAGNNYTTTRTFRAGADGTFGEVLLTVPTTAKRGNASIVTTEQFHHTTSSAILAVTYQPTFSLDSSTARPGSVLTAHGAGFVPGASVTVSVTIPRRSSTSITVSKAVAVNASGAFAAQLSVPAHAIPGTYSVTATGNIAGLKATAQLQVVHLTGQITLSPSSVIPGSSVAVHGAGYVPGDTVQIALYARQTNGSKITLPAVATVDSHGQFTKSIHVPANIAPGTYYVAAKSVATQRTVSITLTISRLSSSLVASPSAALPGQTVNVTGGGLGAGVTVTLSASFPLYGGGSRTVSASAQTNSSGQFSTHFTIPTNAAARAVTVTATGPAAHVSGQLQVRHLNARIASSAYASPGTTITVTGNGYLANSPIQISAAVTLRSGAKSTLAATAVTGRNGQFSAHLPIPANVASGSYTIVARGTTSGRAPSTKLVVAKLVPSIVAAPATVTPGAAVTVNGFGFATGQTITIAINGRKATTATTNSAGKFTVSVTIPSATASGAYTVTGTSPSGRVGTFHLNVQRQVSTHFYFASIYTGNGYSEFLNFLNPTAIPARVTISYQPTTGVIRTKSLTINAHSRATENVNADLGSHVSAGAVVTADVPIAVERLVRHNTDFTGGPGAAKLSTSWFFANGNTSHNYREYVAIENPNSGPVQVRVRFFPTHSHAFTIYRQVGATSRTTVNVNSYVHHDAVGIRVTSNGPVVANRTMYVRHGFTSKIGARAPQTSWYFAGGPINPSAHHWIGAINPTSSRVSITLRTYAPDGRMLGTIHGHLRAFGRAGYLINRIAHQTNAAVVLTSSGPIVAEQTTYVGSRHDASTDTFGVHLPARTWDFASVNTTSGKADVLILFNPSDAPMPVVVQFIHSTGKVSQQTYLVGPLSQRRIDVGSVAPNAQLGLVVTSNTPLVALNRGFANHHLGSETSSGIHL